MTDTTSPAHGWPAVPDAAASDAVLNLGDAMLEYRAEARHLRVLDVEGAPLAAMFVVSYTALPAQPDRPVTYLFNGGPGSASLWLNVGGFGPRRPHTPAPQATLPAPYDVSDNVHSLLRHSDLVFIDAPGTGYSQVAPGVDTARVWGVEQDIDVFSRTVMAHLDHTARWNSPRYLFGESYGTARAAGVAHRLQNMGVDINGVVMLSAILDWGATQPTADQGIVNLFPTYAATARHHGRAAYESLTDAEFDAEAMQFARTHLAGALQWGDDLSPSAEREVADAMAGFTGVASDEYVSRHLRLDLESFRRLLLADQGMLIGRFDTRFTAHHRYVIGDASQDPATDDAATAGVNSAHLSTFRAHLAHDIGYQADRSYVPLNNMQVASAWDWTHRPPALSGPLPMPHFGLNLSAAMRRNPHLRVLVMGGRFDLATPYLGAVHDIGHLFLGEQLRANVAFKRYDSGHMAFVDADALAAMAADLGDFYGRR